MSHKFAATSRPTDHARHPLRALIVEDNEDDFVLLVELCQTLSRYVVACDHQPRAEQGLRRALDAEHDVVFLDYLMPGLDGVAWLERYRHGGGAVPVIALTGAGDEYVAANLTLAGAIAYLNKADLTAERLEALLDLARAEDTRRRTAYQQQAAARRKFETLTPREREVLVQVAEGLTTPQIAARLHRSHETVKDHRAAALRKLGATTSAEAVRIADLAGDWPEAAS